MHVFCVCVCDRSPDRKSADFSLDGHQFADSVIGMCCALLCSALLWSTRFTGQDSTAQYTTLHYSTLSTIHVCRKYNALEALAKAVRSSHFGHIKLIYSSAFVLPRRSPLISFRTGWFAASLHRPIPLHLWPAHKCGAAPRHTNS